MLPSYAHLLEQARFLASRTATAVAVYAVFWIVSRFLYAIIERFANRDRDQHDLILLLAKAARIGVQVFGLITALGTAGIDVSALVAGLGLTGFALGFAFRDVLSNILAGVLLLMYRPFNRGDRIEVTGLTGTVSEIDLRYTILQSEGRIILIPNSNLFTNPIVVTSARRMES